jgi:hypothetical protein
MWTTIFFKGTQATDLSRTSMKAINKVARESVSLSFRGSVQMCRFGVCDLWRQFDINRGGKIFQALK